MTKKLKLYDYENNLLKSSENIEDSIGQIVIENLNPDTTYEAGHFKICWDINGEESIKVDIPKFVTLTSSQDKLIIVTYNEVEPMNIKAENIIGLQDVIDTQFNDHIKEEFMAEINKLIADNKPTQQPSTTTSSPLKDKKVIFIGDSITEVNARTTKNYHQFIADRTGLINVNKGISGTGYQDRKNVAYTITDKPDLICVMLGTNDYGLVGGKTKPLGTAKEHSYTTVAGSIYYTYYQLSKVFPTVPIVVLTPTPRIESNPFKEVENGQGYTLGQLVDVIKEIAKQFSFPVLDLYRESNIRVWDNNVNKTFFAWKEGMEDGLHPNAKGHEFISYTIQSFLESKGTVGAIASPPSIDTSVKDLGNGVYSKLIRPTGMRWKKDTSFVMNMSTDDIDLTANKILNVSYNGKSLINPEGYTSNSPYWYTLPAYEDGNKYNRISEVQNFLNAFITIDDNAQGLEFMRDYIKVIYVDKTKTNIVGEYTQVGYKDTTASTPPTGDTSGTITPVSNGDGTYTATFTPTAIYWKEDQSFMINIDKTKLDLTGKSVTKLEYNGKTLVNNTSLASNSPYWLTVPTATEGTTNNRTPEVKDFVSVLTLESTGTDGRKKYKNVEIKLTYK